jgi:hypothetical protein
VGRNIIQHIHGGISDYAFYYWLPVVSLLFAFTHEQYKINHYEIGTVNILLIIAALDCRGFFATSMHVGDLHLLCRMLRSPLGMQLYILKHVFF